MAGQQQANGSDFYHWQDPRAAALPGYAQAAADLRRCEALGQGIAEAYVRVVDGQVVAIGGIDVSRPEN